MKSLTLLAALLITGCSSVTYQPDKKLAKINDPLLRYAVEGMQS